MFARIAGLLVGRPLPVLAALALLTLGAGISASRIRFDFSPHAIFAGNDDLVTYAEEFKATFGYEDALLMVVIEATGTEDVLDRRALTWQGEVAGRLERLPRVESVRSLATLEVPQVNLSGLSVETVPIVREFPVSYAAEQRVRQTLGESELIKGAMLSDDLRVGAILVLLDPSARDVTSMQQEVRAVAAVLDHYPPPDGYRLHLSGLPAVRVDVVEHLQADQALLFPLAAGLFLVALAFVFRRAAGVVLPLLAVGVGLTWMIGAMSARGESFNIISNILPIMLLIVGISNCVHIVARYAEEASWIPGNRREAARRTLTHMGAACLLTFGTSAIGFGSLAGARSDMLQSFGWNAALGMGLLYVSILLTLGVLLPYFRPPRHRSPDDPSLIVEGVDVIARTVVSRPRTTLAAAAMLVVASVIAGLRVPVNSTIIETYDEEHPSVRTLRLVEEKLGGLLPLEVSLTADEPGRFLDPEVYRKVAAAAEYADDRSEVTFARSYVDMHQEVYAKFRHDDSLRHELPALGEEGAQRIRRSRALIRDAGETIGYSAFVSPEGTRARILLRVRDIGSRRMLGLIGDLERKLDELFPPQSGITARLTGDAYLNARAMDSFVRDLYSSLLTASLMIFVLIGLLFWSVRIGLIAMIPNVTPLFLTLSYMWLRGYEMNAGNVVVFSISLGIAVDDTIHYLTRFREELAASGDVREAVFRAGHSTGRAIVLTSLFIVSGLAVLLLSDFVPTRRFAELTSITMLTALFGDLLLLPASLVLFWKQPRARKAAVAEVAAARA